MGGDDWEGIIGKLTSEKPPRMSGRDAPLFLVRTDSHQTLYLVRDDGQAAAIAVQNVPTVEHVREGVNYANISPLHGSGVPVSIFSLPVSGAQSDLCVATITRQGLIKKSLVSDLKGPSSDLFTLVKLNDDDELVDVCLVNDKSQYLVVSRNGMVIRFDGREARVMGMVAAGVNAIKLGDKDVVVGMVELAGKGDVVLVASSGMSWRIELDNFPVQGRYGQGVIGCRLEKGVELIGVVFGKKNYQYTLKFKKAAAKTYRGDEIGISKRAGRGEQLVKLIAGDRVEKIVKSSDFGE